MPRCSRALSLLTAGVLATAGLAVANAPGSAAAAPGPTEQPQALPSVYPTPQSMQAHGPDIPLGPRVALIAGSDSDPSAVSAVRQTLAAAGVDRIDTTAQPGETAVYVGGAAAEQETAQLHATDASQLPADGYVLVTGRDDQDQARVVLDGRDATGTFYAAQTLRQLVERRGQSAHLPGVEVRDWPDQSLRGVIEGFYGTPWSDAQRLAQMDFYGAHKMNSYVYSPKDDPYLRAQWRDAYPPDKLAVLQKLVQRATANHVEFTYALSPGLSICYSSQTDEQALVAKFQSLWDIGVRSFSIPLDDISYTKWNCAADKAKWGTGGGAAGEAQAYLLNEVQHDFIATRPGADRLQMVPTEYYNVTPSPYKTAIHDDLDPAVVVGWTGVGVVPATITTAQAAQAKSVFGHDILLWDNYPVNDYVTDRLLLGPYVGREPGLSANLYGTTANPMIQPEASKLALFTAADFFWNSGDYDANSSWQAALDELSGGDPAARSALAAFADLERYSTIDPVQAPVLAARIARFWPAWERGDDQAVPTLDSYLKIIQNAQATLTQRMDDPEFVTEAKPWLASAAAWGTAARDALQMLVDERAGHATAALADRAAAEAAAKQARSYTYDGLRGTVHVTVGDGVIDQFVTDALAENDRWLGLAGRHVTATTSMGTYQSYAPANMVDGDPSTWFWSNGSPSAGDYVGVDLGAVQPITSVKITGGDASSPNDYIHVGTLEYSSDGSTWTDIGSYANQPTISATLPAGTQARYVRLRATQSDGYWVKIHEFSVTGPDTASPTVSGTPAAASGSSLAAAADGNVDTAYQAANPPADGDALVVTLPKARPLAEVGVVGTGDAAVEAQVDGSWQQLGSLSPSGYTELPADGRTVSAIRLAWQGGPAPSIAEVVPWYADVPAAGLSATPASLDTTVNDPAPLAVQLTATQPADLPGVLAVDAGPAVQVDPAATTTTLYRGGQQQHTITLSSATPGSYPVRITFSPDNGAPVTEQVTLVVHPAVSSTNVAGAAQGATATASSTEDGLARFTPDHAIDGDQSTRWSSDHTDDQWLQVQFAAPQHLGKVVIDWEAAHASSYALETSADGTTWDKAQTVTDSKGGVETLWLDAPDVRYLRMQGISRATQYGYSIYEFAAYPMA
ncbi:MAG TPA: beta-N-acetylglucosaminidase domain-containing protein [Jatrophihabitans sp.]|nr:beta-N-acetylglucosaminidase domain-containing protein [Jatrophihabitans sp.]